MSIKVWIGDEEVIRKGPGPSNVRVETGSAPISGDPLVSITLTISGERREIEIGGSDLVHVIKVLAADPRLEQWFRPELMREALLKAAKTLNPDGWSTDGGKRTKSDQWE